MDIITGLTLLPLQITDMSVFGNDARLGTNAKYLAIGAGVMIAVLIIINILKNKLKLSVLNDAGEGALAPRRFHMSTFHQIVRNLGLNREQAKMLDFVFRSGSVTDPVRSLNSSTLIDQYFKRAYRIIEYTSISEEEMTQKLSVLFATRNIIENDTNSATAASTRQIPDNASAMITVNNENYPVRVYSSKGDSLVVGAPKTDSGELLVFHNGSRINLSFSTKNNKGFSVESRVMGVAETADGMVLRLVHSGQIKKVSNRRFRRRQMVISTSFFLVFAENPGHKKERLLVDKHRLLGSILDISIGGCSIRTTFPVTSGQKLKIEFTREDNSVIAALGEVLRVNRTGKKDVIIHVKFIKIPRRSLNTINAVVYDYAND